jgi:hypothetical protein
MHLELELGVKTALRIADVASGMAQAQELRADSVKNPERGPSRRKLRG